MYEIIFTFRSLTKAQQAITVLRVQYIAASLVQSPEMPKNGGCGYAVQVSGLDGSAAALILTRNHIDYLKVYRKIYNLPPEEVFL